MPSLDEQQGHPENQETPEDEQKDFKYIDEFVKSLDPDELNYLKGCISGHEHPKDDNGDTELNANDMED